MEPKTTTPQAPTPCMHCTCSGASVNVPNAHGITPLHRAAKNGLLEIAEVLVRYGADLHATNHRGHTALDWAKTEPLRERILTVAHELVPESQRKQAPLPRQEEHIACGDTLAAAAQATRKKEDLLRLRRQQQERVDNGASKSAASGLDGTSHLGTQRPSSFSQYVSLHSIGGTIADHKREGGKRIGSAVAGSAVAALVHHHQRRREEKGKVRSAKQRRWVHGQVDRESGAGRRSGMGGGYEAKVVGKGLVPGRVVPRCRSMDYSLPALRSLLTPNPSFLTHFLIFAPLPTHSLLVAPYSLPTHFPLSHTTHTPRIPTHTLPTTYYPLFTHYPTGPVELSREGSPG